MNSYAEMMVQAEIDYRLERARRAQRPVRRTRLRTRRGEHHDTRRVDLG